MNDSSPGLPSPIANPFATRYVASARLLPRDEHGHRLDLPTLLLRLADLGGSAAIIGPHGTGKTTLLGHLARVAEEGGRLVHRARARHRTDSVWIGRDISRLQPGCLACLDSWEALGPLGGMVVLALARGRGVALLVTSHRRGVLPTLVTTRGSAALLAALMADLPDFEAWFGRDVHAADVAAAVSPEGDLRLAFDRLYDLYEGRTRGLLRRNRAAYPVCAGREDHSGSERGIHDSPGGIFSPAPPAGNLG